MFIRVDLPARVSPSRAWTSPHRTSRSTPSLALSSPKVLTTPVSLRAAGVDSCLDPGLERTVLELGFDAGDLGFDVRGDLGVPLVVWRQTDAVVGDIEGQ